jgi:pimeloyl-ACP methyl ester carboxylesterase
MLAVTLEQKGFWGIPGVADHVRVLIRGMIGVAPIEVSPQKSAMQIRVPVLIVHGKLDEKVPIVQGRAVFDAIPPGRKDFLELPEAGHDDMLAAEKPWAKQTLRHVLHFFGQTGLNSQ